VLSCGPNNVVAHTMATMADLAKLLKLVRVAVRRQERIALGALQTQGKSKIALDRSECILRMFHLVEFTIRSLKQSLIGCAILRINRNANAH
jgi:hypothetical protein